MNNRFRLDAQKYGGKLYKMAQPYLSNQTVEAQPEPVSEPPMTNPDSITESTGFKDLDIKEKWIAKALNGQEAGTLGIDVARDRLAHYRDEKVCSELEKLGWTPKSGYMKKEFMGVNFAVSSNATSLMGRNWVDVQFNVSNRATKEAETVANDMTLTAADLAKQINEIVESKMTATNPDRDYLQSIIDGKVDGLTVNFDQLIALAEKYEGNADMNPIVDQALEVINQAQQAASKGI
jgi:hypothetical protein